jgi:hypothetical protein
VHLQGQRGGFAGGVDWKQAGSDISRERQAH